jgi:NAD(P)-dependent dehydrogenase (short-subunit alcohol dehydrogenase family)
VVSTASARARGRVADLDRDAVRLSFDVKVLGPLMLAKHLAPRMGEGGSFVIFSGVAATKRRIGTTDDVPNTVLFAMSSTFPTGQTLHIDGGEPLT